MLLHLAAPDLPASSSLTSSAWKQSDYLAKMGACDLFSANDPAKLIAAIRATTMCPNNEHAQRRAETP
ncbi:MAG: hypothetical protein IPP19_13125 [Verrucomicrobia bacterium]|nr:hypothetical protein [Verrucomicrobiota bacterium]